MTGYFCKNCFKEFYAYPSQRRKFCSLRCKSKWQSRHIRGKKHPNYTEKIKIICETCEKPVYVTSYYIGKKRFCSRVCKNIGHSKEISGERNCFWKGGISEKYKRWGAEFNNRLKKQIKIRDNYTCQNCLIHQESTRCKFVIHHINFMPKDNSLANLQLLCNSCHVSIHKNL